MTTFNADAIFIFDARGVAKRFRHAAIFGALESLGKGDTMRFINDHDPLPLLDQISQRYRGQVSVAYVERTPEQVIIDFAVHPHQHHHQQQATSGGCGGDGGGCGCSGSR